MLRIRGLIKKVVLFLIELKKGGGISTTFFLLYQDYSNKYQII